MTQIDVEEIILDIFQYLRVFLIFIIHVKKNLDPDLKFIIKDPDSTKSLRIQPNPDQEHCNTLILFFGNLKSGNESDNKIPRPIKDFRKVQDLAPFRFMSKNGEDKIKGEHS